MPQEAEFLFVDPDPHYDAESLALYSQDPATLSDTQIEQRARAMVSRIEAQLTPARLAALAASVDTEAVHSLFRLIATTGYPDPRLARALKREFLAAIDRWSRGE
jgi:transcriptional regulator, MerR family